MKLFLTNYFKKIANVPVRSTLFVVSNCCSMTSIENSGSSSSLHRCMKRKRHDELIPNGLTNILQKFVNSCESLKTSEKLKEENLLKNVPESVKNFFLLYMKQVNAITNLYESLDHLLENSKSPLGSNKIVSQLHKVSVKGIDGLKGLTNFIIEELNANSNNSSISMPSVESASKLRRLDSSTISQIDDKSSSQNDDIYFVGSDSDLELEVLDRVTEKAEDNKSSSSKSEKDKKYPLNYDTDGYVRVFIDGCCLSNGRSNAQAGIGVWFGDSNPLNLSKPVIGVQSNNNAEIQAATQAIKKANSIGVKKLRLYTDSQFVINCMTKWIFSWKQKNWTTSQNKPVINKISLMELDKVIPCLEAVDWKYVEAHKGIIGNENADFLAKQGALKK